LLVRELDKAANERCQHQGRGGCAIYHKFGFPHSCALWSCRWLVDDETEGLRRPDRTGYVVDIMPDIVRVGEIGSEAAARDIPCFQVWCDPARPEAWRDPALLRFAAHRAAENGEIMLVRYSSAKAITVLAPSTNPTGEWVVIENGDVAESPSGNLLLDKLKGVSA
jgi:hypothetical protein